MKKDEERMHKKYRLNELEAKSHNVNGAFDIISPGNVNFLKRLSKVDRTSRLTAIK